MAHWLLAFTYFKLAKNYPRIIAGTIVMVKDYTLLLWGGIVISTVLPLLEIAAWIWH